MPCSYITSSPVMRHSVPVFDPPSGRKLASWKSRTSVRNIRCRMATHVGSEFLDAVPYQCCVHCSIFLQQEWQSLALLFGQTSHILQASSMHPCFSQCLKKFLFQQCREYQLAATDTLLDWKRCILELLPRHPCPRWNCMRGVLITCNLCSQIVSLVSNPGVLSLQ